MSKIHLICNAHIDPVWQWDWQEGVCAALSTFASAVDLAEDFDYIFCHGEVTLYKFVEEYAPALFAKIQKLVKEGKWHIMGGWYLQPDNNMPSGESFTRQILVGKEYFEEKFGVDPTTAICFDAFGHTRGLVQIITKCGQDSMLICRPHRDLLPLEHDQFLWEGLDGSTIKVNRSETYNSPLGNAVNNIKEKIADMKARGELTEAVCVLWGVGNHGGGPSRKDLQDIASYMKESEHTLVHSTPEVFIADIQPSYKVNHSLWTAMPGCYTSMSNVKKLHIELENELYSTERICAVAALKTGNVYPTKELRETTVDLLNAEFHDILPGSMVRSGEGSAFRYIYSGLFRAENCKMKAFYSLLDGEKKAYEGEYPIFVFNMQPYDREENIVCEFMLSDQNWDTENVSHIFVYDEDRNCLPCQVIKEESNITLDWRKKIVFSGKLKALSLNRFSVEVQFKPVEETKLTENLTFVIGENTIAIDKQTGLLRSFKVGGREYIKDGFQPLMFDDNADPWAMSKIQQKQMGKNPVPFALQGGGLFGDLENVHIVEHGDIYTAVECFFHKDNSRVRLEYKIYNNKPYIDVDVDVFWQEANKMLKLAIPVQFDGTFVGQTAFGTNELFMDGRECVAHRFMAIEGTDRCLAVLNNCSYACSYKDNTMYLSLVRGTSYAAHPIPDFSGQSTLEDGIRELITSKQFVKKADQGERNFSFRVVVCQKDEMERYADEFNLKPYAVNAFPLGLNKAMVPFNIKISDSNIVLHALKKADKGEGYILRLMNNSKEIKSVELCVLREKIDLDFGKYEVKTVEFNGQLEEIKQLKI